MSDNEQEDVIQTWQKFAEEWKKAHPETQHPQWVPEPIRPHGGACPRCGYCPHCGRGSDYPHPNRW